MILKDNIQGEVYRRFVDYAISTSDMFLYVTKGAPQIIDNTNFLRNIRTNDPELYNHNIVQKCKDEEKQIKYDLRIYQDNYMPFIPHFAPYLIKQRISGGNNRKETLGWPATEKIIAQEHYSVNCYLAKVETKSLLLEPESYLGWRYPKYPEDLSFFRNNLCWSVVTSHEKLIQIFPKDREEYQILKNMGINFAEDYIPTKKEWMFYEEY